MDGERGRATGEAEGAGCGALLFEHKAEPVGRHSRCLPGWPTWRYPGLGWKLEWIVTGNIRDIAAGELVFDSFRVVTPGDWLKMEDD